MRPRSVRSCSVPLPALTIDRHAVTSIESAVAGDRHRQNAHALEPTPVDIYTCGGPGTKVRDTTEGAP